MFNMCSQSSCEILKYSDKPMGRYAGKEYRQNSRRKRKIHLSKEEDYYNYYREPGRVPFKWEIQPGVPKPQDSEGELMGDEVQALPAPLKLPPSAHSAHSASAADILSSDSPKKNGCYFSWNFSYLYRQSINSRQDSLQRGDIHDNNGDSVDHDTVSSNFELDSNEELSSVSNKDHHSFHNHGIQLATAPSSPARRALMALLVGVFPCISMANVFSHRR